MNEELQTRTIKALSLKRKSEGSIGFMTTEEDKWYNVYAEESALNVLLETILAKGNVITFKLELGVPTDFMLVSKPEKSNNMNNGNSAKGDMTTFEDLLEDAHDKFDGNFSIRTELISHDAEKKTAVVKAIVEITDEGLSYEYQAHGDADQGNCGDIVKQHYLRMAETRAISRALRWATNNAKCSEEETETGALTEEEMTQALEENLSKE